MMARVLYSHLHHDFVPDRIYALSTVPGLIFRYGSAHIDVIGTRDLHPRGSELVWH